MNCPADVLANQQLQIQALLTNPMWPSSAHRALEVAHSSIPISCHWEGAASDNKSHGSSSSSRRGCAVLQRTSCQTRGQPQLL